jgi:hypothetical protein
VTAVLGSTIKFDAMRRVANARDHTPSVTTTTSMAGIFKDVVFYLDESLGEKVKQDVSMSA